MLRLLRSFLAAFGFTGLIAPGMPFAQVPSEDYVLIGAGLRSRPAYDGSASQVTDPIPMLRYYGKPWFLRTTQGMLEGGTRIALNAELHIGAQLAYEAGRQRSESSFLTINNMPDINPGISYGAHFEWDHKIGPMPLNLLARARQNANSARGAQYDLRLTAGIYGGERLSAGMFAQQTWADTKSAQTFYGVTAQQSANSNGLIAFDAGGGALFAGAGFLWGYEISRNWMLSGAFEARHLRGDATRSPLAEKRSNNYASASLAYRF